MSTLSLKGASSGKPRLLLACPICQQPLTAEATQAARCENGHSFDRARQGYLNLLPAQHKKSRAPGDDSQMVAARTAFLDQGHYQPIADKLAEQVSKLIDSETESEADKIWQIADVGCGEGYYTHALSKALTEHSLGHQLYAVDISKEAIRAACRRTGKHSDPIHWLVASGGKLPLLKGKLDMIISLFTPVMPEGWRTALKPGGKLLLVIPADQHLLELRQALYQEVRDGSFDPKEQLEKSGFIEVESERLTRTVDIPNADLPALLDMTPHGWRASPETKKNVTTLSTLATQIDVHFRSYKLK